MSLFHREKSRVHPSQSNLLTDTQLRGVNAPTAKLLRSPGGQSFAGPTGGALACRGTCPQDSDVSNSCSKRRQSSDTLLREETCNPVTPCLGREASPHLLHRLFFVDRGRRNEIWLLRRFSGDISRLWKCAHRPRAIPAFRVVREAGEGESVREFLKAAADARTQT